MPEPVTIHNKDEFLCIMAEVIVEWPLYRPFRFAGNVVETTYTQGVNPHEVKFVQLPSEMVRHCRRCQHEQRWRITNLSDAGKLYRFGGEFSEIVYACKNCSVAKSTYFFCFKIDQANGFVQKVGQFPPLEREPSKVMASAMTGEDLKLYRNALTCRHSTFGIGAIAYLRRIVENRINDLLDLVAEAARTDTSKEILLQEVKAVKADRRFSEKIEFAAQLLPSGLIRGENPIATLHALTSAGLHGESDDECVEVFDVCRLALEHVIKRLKEAQEEDAGYEAAMKALAERKAKRVG